MELQNLRNEIHLAKKAAKESGDLLINRKSVPKTINNLYYIKIISR